MGDVKKKRDDTVGEPSPSAVTPKEMKKVGEGVAATASDAWDKTKEVGQRAADAASVQMGRLADGTRDVLSNSRDFAREHGDDIYNFIKANPVTMMFAGVGIGILIGFAAGANRASKRKYNRWWH